MSKVKETLKIEVAETTANGSITNKGSHVKTSETVVTSDLKVEVSEAITADTRTITVSVSAPAAEPTLAILLRQKLMCGGVEMVLKEASKALHKELVQEAPFVRTYSAETDENGVFDGRDIAQGMIRDAFRLVVPYAEACPVCSNEIFAMMTQHVLFEEYQSHQEGLIGIRMVAGKGGKAQPHLVPWHAPKDKPKAAPSSYTCIHGYYEKEEPPF